MNGKHVNMVWDSFEATAPGGYGQLRSAQVLPKRGRRIPMRQGDLVEAHRPNGRICYQGKLTAPPKYVVSEGIQGHVGIITAMGPRTTVDAFTDRLPYQIADPSQWSEGNSQPFNYDGYGNPAFHLISKGDLLGFATIKGQDYVLNTDYAGYAIYTGSASIQEVSFTIKKSGASDLPKFQLIVQSATDFGSTTTEATYVLSNAANPDGTTRSVAFTANQNVALIAIQCNTSVTTTATVRAWLRDLRVGVITDQDSFTSRDVAADVAARCGYAFAGSGSMNMLPLDWNGPATELLNYIAALEDQTWLVVASGTRQYGKLIFRDWGNNVWHVSLRDGSAEDGGLEILPLYDAHTTTWESPGGVPRHLRSKVADFNIHDPLPGIQADYPDPISLQDPQRTNDLASAVNQRALQRLTQMRVQGSVTVRKTHIRQPFDILPGDLLDIGDFQPSVPPQRIAGVTYNRDGSVTCSLTRDLNLDVIVDRIAKRRHTRHRPRRG